MIENKFETTCSSQRFHNQAPQLSWVNTITYGAMSPFVVPQGGDHIAQRAETMKQHADDDSSDFYLGPGRWEA